MANPMRRPAFRARIRWHTWMPWYEFSRMVGEFQDHEERAGGMLLPALGIALVTLAAAMLAPQLSLLITVAGGGSIVGALTWGSGDGRRLWRGVKVVGLPSPRTFLHLSAEMAADDLVVLWHGQPRPAGLLAGPTEGGWTREETIIRYHLWRQARESLPPADRTAAAIAAAVGFDHEELMDALLAHKLRLADLDAAGTGHAGYLGPTLEGKLLGRSGAQPLALPAPRDGGTDDGQHAAAVQVGHASGGAWQYHTEVIPPREMKEYERTMNTMGADGWELVAVYPLSLAGRIRSADGNTTDVQVIWKRRVG